jgi:hypothetical protein
MDPLVHIPLVDPSYPNLWGRIDSAIPFATLATISNDYIATNPLWEVDTCTWNFRNGTFYLIAFVTVQDTDGKVVRICFNATILGELVSQIP